MKDAPSGADGASLLWEVSIALAEDAFALEAVLPAVGVREFSLMPPFLLDFVLGGFQAAVFKEDIVAAAE
jgi:hypothetical protein